MCRQEDNVWEARDKLVSCHLQIRKIHRNSRRSIGQNKLMNQEWHCTSNPIAQFMIVLILQSTTISRQYFIKVAMTRLCCTTTCWPLHWTKMVTFESEVLLERKPPTLIEPEATLGDRNDLRISGQLEEPHLLNERQPREFLISSLMKHVLKSPGRLRLRFGSRDPGCNPPGANDEPGVP